MAPGAVDEEGILRFTPCSILDMLQAIAVKWQTDWEI